MRQAESDMEVAFEAKKNVAVQLKGFLFTKGELELEVKALKTKHNAEADALQKLEPPYSTLKRIKALVQEKQTKGYLGLMIDFIDCDQRFAACLDLAAKSKLFSIIVEDLEAAKDILSLNSQIKGGVINIFPLSMADQQQDK